MNIADGFVDALGIQGGNLVFNQAGGFGMTSDENAEDLADTVQFASLEKAVLFRQMNTVRDWTPDGRFVEYPVLTSSPKVLGQYGVGLELYFTMLKHFAILFFLISLISIWPMIENYEGSGLDDGDKKNDYDLLTLANNGGFRYSYTSSSVTAADLELIYDDIKKDIDDSEDAQIRLAIADFLYTLLFIAFILFYK